MIDVHTHLHPPRLFAAIRHWFAERSPWVLEHPTEPAAVARALLDAGVERFVFCSYAHKPGIARDLNAWLAQTARDLHGHGLALATVHLDDPGHLDDLRDALDAGCIGLKIHEDVQKLAVDDPRFTPVFELLAARGGFVLAHIGPIPWNFDTRRGPARVATVLERHPALRFVVAHLGVPDSLEYFALAQTYLNLFVDTTMAFAAQSHELRADIAADAIERASGAIVFGSDFPNIPYAYDGDRAGIRALGLSAGAEQAIFRDNARRLHHQLAR